MSNLVLSWCRDITDRSVVASARNCPYLEVVDLTFCKNVTDFGVTALLELRFLKRLNLSGCLISKNLVEVIILKSKNFLRILALDMTYCPEITQDLLKKLCKETKGKIELTKQLQM